MQVFVINLDRATDRMQRMRTLLDGLGLAWARIPAVDGKALEPEALRTWSAARDDGSLILTPGEVGILLSQRQAWQNTVEQDKPCVVLEDDVHIADSARHWLAHTDWLPADADIVKFETTLRPVSVDRQAINVGSGLRLARLRSGHLGLAGYIITPKAALRLLKAIGQSAHAVDHLVFDPVSPLFDELVIYQTLPALCIQDQFLPSHQVGLGGEIERAWAVEKKKQKRTLLQKLGREVQRLASQAAFAWRGNRLNPSSRLRNLRVPFEEK
ncbi:hypothetical protein ASD54_04435 [Rhizobium sp. Root149]|uniref:glycosyltransferase family 25 protein n=1 Tax=Rhizobium sp. Root149 TaxID=1736473 RepID=UPI000712A852|nr:glycosyltransferase family 25 protein [Rhizobium sp. Root149]KQZ54583.1 hypothetical protein ASD54_04435 [Rhizobium sp. Root149]